MLVTGIADDLGSIAALYQAKREYEQAKQMHQQALHMYEKVGFREGQVDTLVNLGILARDIHEFGGAERHIAEALILVQEIGNPCLLYDVYLNRGDLYLLANRLQEAAKDYTASVAAAEAIRIHLLLEEEALGFFDELRLEAYDRLVRLYAHGLGNPR